MAEWFDKLSSNDPNDVDNAKQKCFELFSTVKDSWLVNGLYDQYIATNSVPTLEILINVRESHHDFLFNKLYDSLTKGSNEIKFQALILLGHVVRKQPTWLFKITEKQLFKELLKLLKNETDIVLLVSALLLLIVLLPCIPYLMSPHLQDVFDIFSRLAAWNSSNTLKMNEEQLVHVQIGLYALLHRLYGMYPCNFVGYLRQFYKNKEASNVFKHTIQPMLQTVQMHPMLVTSTKDYELSLERWKEMTPHDVVVECERYSVGLRDRFAHDACFASSTYRSRSATLNSSTLRESYQAQLQNMHFATIDNDFFSPSQMLLYTQTPPATLGNETPTAAIPVAHQGQITHSQEGTSPPEAAIEATPETTPIKDTRLLAAAARQQQLSIAHVAVARAHNFGGRGSRTTAVSSTNTTPTHSQPSSPMRFANKDAAHTAVAALNAFNFNASSLLITATDHSSAFNQPSITHKRDSLANQKLAKLKHFRAQVNEGNSVITNFQPTSPLRLISTEQVTALNKRTESPVSQEDEEVQSIVKKSLPIALDPPPGGGTRQCDSVLQEHEHNPECEQGSPCTSGGLHMPNPKQMTAFKNNMKRLRHHSQCAQDPDVNDSSGSSPCGLHEMTMLDNVTVRRANSCPEMKKNTPLAAGTGKPLEEHDEDDVGHGLSNGFEATRKTVADVITQTETVWPMPYEHLFLSIFPNYDVNEVVRASPAPSPAPFVLDKFNYASSHDILDKYVDVAFQCHVDAKDPARSLRDQLLLGQQQLIFERYRRETHAAKNRTLFTDVTKIKVLEEHNSALTDQVNLQERDIVRLMQKIDEYRKENHSKAHENLDKIQYWEQKYQQLNNQFVNALDINDQLQRELSIEKEKLHEINLRWQQAESSLVNTEAEAKVIREQVQAGERGRMELEQVNRELLLAGEAILKYRERLAHATATNASHVEHLHISEAYEQEIKSLHAQLELRATELIACRSRIVELDASLQQYDDGIKVHKKYLNDAKDECNERIKSIESKYQSQLSINRALEGKILEQYQQDIHSRHGLHSPDTSSCHEVNVASTERTGTGMSPHSSPLSASLTSSEGSMAFTQG